MKLPLIISQKMGSVININTEKFLKGQISNSGYLNYNLTLKNNVKKRLYAHRLVVEAYLPNTENKTQVNHKDGNKLNNSVLNLEWVTPIENIAHAISTNLKVYPKVYCFLPNLSLYRIFNSQIEAAKELNITADLISQEILKDSSKQLTGGFYWSKENFISSEDIICYLSTGKAKPVVGWKITNPEKKYYFNSANEAARFLGTNNHSHVGGMCQR